MFRKMVVSATVALLLSLATPSAEAQAQEKKERTAASEAFGVYTHILASSPEITEGELVGMLRKDGFRPTTADKNWWALDDRTGRLVIIVFPRSTMLRFFLATSHPTAAPILAALVTKGEIAGIEGGDTVQIALRTKELFEGGRHGERRQWLTFSLVDGRVIETTTSIKWTAGK